MRSLPSSLQNRGDYTMASSHNFYRPPHIQELQELEEVLSRLGVAFQVSLPGSENVENLDNRPNIFSEFKADYEEHGLPSIDDILKR